MESHIHIQRLANREPLHSRAVVARQDTRARQARSGRHSATTSSSSLTLAGWNIRSLGVHSDLNSAPRKSAVIDCELSRLRVDISAISETWLLGSGSVRERNYTIFWCGYPDDHLPMHGVGFAVRNTLLSTVSQPIACSPPLADKRAARLSVLQDRNDFTVAHYRNARNDVKHLTRQAYKQYWQDLSEKVERCASTYDL
ncbi:hypothetical protein G5714_019326 [Onychostoma macrolepis]|uniref:Uncharacterized protein n=1 Tax=Onychostoma macrolepis TaxID=369639 RepID=A0A7J6BW59_9TELE|nr:hypothetical protein G5714_019326 [Onychostoma macrolepis]